MINILGYFDKTALFLLQYGAAPMDSLFDLMNLSVETVQHESKKWLLEIHCLEDKKQNLALITEEFINHGAETTPKGTDRISTLSYVCQLGKF